MNVAVIIPARLESERFPRKMLANRTGKPLIQHTWEQAQKAELVDRVIIATDSREVLNAALQFGAECELTSPRHKSGTDRIAEVAKQIREDIIINVQGDEPRIDPSHIDKLARFMLGGPSVRMATLAAPFKHLLHTAHASNVKVVVDVDGKALYFSRSVIPYDRDHEGNERPSTYLHHMGVYAYRREFLLKFATMPQGRLEGLEKLEQLRAIENGYDVYVLEVDYAYEGIDTPEQYNWFVVDWRREKRRG